jgi:hypothetical protein
MLLVTLGNMEEALLRMLPLVRRVNTQTSNKTKLHNNQLLPIDHNTNNIATSIKSSIFSKGFLSSTLILLVTTGLQQHTKLHKA